MDQSFIFDIGVSHGWWWWWWWWWSWLWLLLVLLPPPLLLLLVDSVLLLLLLVVLLLLLLLLGWYYRDQLSWCLLLSVLFCSRYSVHSFFLLSAQCSLSSSGAGKDFHLRALGGQNHTIRAAIRMQKRIVQGQHRAKHAQKRPCPLSSVVDACASCHQSDCTFWCRLQGRPWVSGRPRTLLSHVKRIAKCSSDHHGQVRTPTLAEFTKCCLAFRCPRQTEGKGPKSPDLVNLLFFGKNTGWGFRIWLVRSGLAKHCLLQPTGHVRHLWQR